MNRLHKARWKNALRKYAKINRYLSKGYLVFNDFNQLETDKYMYCGKEKYIYTEHKHGDMRTRFIYFRNNPDTHEGLHTPINIYNEKFNNWKIVHPKDIKAM